VRSVNQLTVMGAIRVDRLMYSDDVVVYFVFVDGFSVYLLCVDL